jgi:hypothetical protein
MGDEAVSVDAGGGHEDHRHLRLSASLSPTALLLLSHSVLHLRHNKPEGRAE